MNSLKIQTHDVGQADAHSITTPHGQRVLFDADVKRIGDVFNEMNNFENDSAPNERTNVDYFHISHIHADHVEGTQYLKDAGVSIQQAGRPPAYRSEIGPNGGVDPNVLEDLREALLRHGIERPEPVSEGDTILDEDDVSLTALSPPATDEDIKFTRPSTGYQCEYGTEKANPNGVTCRLDGPDVSCLFMGDVGDESAHNAESWLVAQHDDEESEVNLDADVLYLGHHGSYNATTKAFLERVDPDHVVISSGLTNGYTSENQYDGHPHDKTLKRLHERDVDTYWTAVHGTINVEDDEEVQIDHTTGIETTAAADLAALKYHTRTNDLDREQLEDIEEIDTTALPDETPDWIREASLITESDQTAADTTEQEDETQTQQDDQRHAKIDTLHTLEAEHRNLTERKEYLEGKRERLTEEKAELEEEAETTSGVWDRVTNTVRQFRRMDSDAEPDDREPNETEETTDETLADRDQSENTDTDSKPYHQADDIDEAIEIIEQDNASLTNDVEELTQATHSLKTDIETLEQQRAAPSGFRERVNSVLGSFSGTGQTDSRIISQPRASGALSPNTGQGASVTTDDTPSSDGQTPTQSRTNDGQSVGNPQQNTAAEPKREQSDDSRHSRTENRDRDHSTDFGR